MTERDLHQIILVRSGAKDRVKAILDRVFAGDPDFDTMAKFLKALGSDLVCVIEGEFLQPWRDSLYGTLEGIVVLQGKPGGSVPLWFGSQ